LLDRRCSWRTTAGSFDLAARTGAAGQLEAFMTSNAVFHDQQGRRAPTYRTAEATRYFVPLGRLFFVAIFVMSGPMHFKSAMVEHASNAGVPFASFLVPASGVIALLGGLSVLLGYHARWGAWLLVLFLIPVTFAMHQFWNVGDPQMAMMQQVMFMKNISILGGALMIAHFGAGPISIDEHAERGR
jgi:putative oxidoreductase